MEKPRKNPLENEISDHNKSCHTLLRRPDNRLMSSNSSFNDMFAIADREFSRADAGKRLESGWKAPVVPTRRTGTGSTDLKYYRYR